MLRNTEAVFLDTYVAFIQRWFLAYKTKIGHWQEFDVKTLSRPIVNCVANQFIACQTTAVVHVGYSVCQ